MNQINQVPTVPSPDAVLALRDITAAIEKFGVPIQYRKSMRCPCADAARGEPDFNCSKCRGDGWLWDEPLRDENGDLLTAMIRERLGDKDFREYGAWENGTAFATLPVTVIPAHMDKIIPVNDTITVNDEILIKGDLFNDGASAELLRYSAVRSVEKITTLEAEYYPDQDFRVVGNRIEWIADVPFKTAYSVRYTATPEYLIFKQNPRLRMFGLAEKPFMVQMMLLDKVRPTKGE